VALAAYDTTADMSSRRSIKSPSSSEILMKRRSSSTRQNNNKSQINNYLTNSQRQEMMMTKQGSEHSLNSGHSISSIASSTSVLRGCVLKNSKQQDFVVSTPSIDGSAVGESIVNNNDVTADLRHPSQALAISKNALHHAHASEVDEDASSAASELTEGTTSISHPMSAPLQVCGNSSSHAAHILRKQATFFYDSESDFLQSQAGELHSIFSNADSEADESSSVNTVDTAGATTIRPMRPALLQNWHRKLTLDICSDNRRSRNISILRDKYDFPNGLAKQMCRSLLDFPLRIWLVDNSDSMNTMDGLCFVHGKSRAKQMLSCSRWKELKETVRYHAELAMDLGAPTLFRFITDPALANPKIPKDKKQMMGICISEVEKKNHEREWVMTGLKEDDDFQWEDFAHSDFEALTEVLDQVKPRYTTPLAENVRIIKKQIERLHLSLIDNRQRVCVIIATDGIPEDISDFQDAIIELHELPVWVVIRLCTSHDAVLHFWTSFDLDLEFDLDVIDDFKSEAEEVLSCNPWLTYVEPVHRAREWGYSHRIFDLLDEVSFEEDLMAEYCSTIFGVSVHDLKPEGDESWWLNFYYDIVSLLEREKKYYDPLSSSYKKLINTHTLGDVYGGKLERRRRRRKVTAKPEAKTEPLSALQEEDERFADDSGADLKFLDMNASALSASNKGCCVLS